MSQPAKSSNSKSLDKDDVALKEIIRVHHNDITCIQREIMKDLIRKSEEGEGERSILDNYMTSLIKNECNYKKGPDYYDKLGIKRNTTSKPSDPSFPGLRCSKCKEPSDSFDVSVEHLTKCFKTCENLCGAKVCLSDDMKNEIGSQSKKENEKIAKELHKRECIMVCQAPFIVVDYEEDCYTVVEGRYCDTVMTSPKDMVTHLTNCRHVRFHYCFHV